MIYRLTYCNKDGVKARVDIQKGSSTPVIEVEGTERPFILSYNNDKGDKSGMFLSSSADIEIYETTDFNIDNLKTSNETELSVTHYINNVISWQGFIIPDFFSIEIRNNPVITMTASDRLGTLKNVTLSDLPSMISLRELAILCLNKTGLELTLRTMADFNNGTGVNDFFNSKVLTQRLSDTKGRSISCYDILSSILTASNSFLVQRSGGWHIINKIQHEAGSGKLYTGAASFINWSDVIFNFSDISTGGRRTIIPVASTVGVFHEFGGGRIYPENYDFSLDLTGWTSVNGFVAVIDNRKVDNFVSGTGVIPQEWTTDPVFGDPTEKKYLVNDNYGINYDFADKPYLRSSNIPVTYPNLSQVKVNVEVNATGPYIDSETYRGETNFAVIASNGTSTLHLTGSGTFEPLSGDPFLHKVLFDGDTHLQAVTSSRSVNGVLAVQDGNLSGYDITVRLYGYTKGVTGGRFLVTTLVNSVAVTITDISDEPKGTLYKTERVDNFTKAHDIDTSLFADYLTTGLNGYFYDYSIDDTSSLYNSANELTSKWTAYNDPEQLPLLQHITRQKSRLFSVAHDLLSAELEVNNFDPLAIFVACEKRYTVVSAQFDFFKSNLSVELEEVAFQNATVRDFIYSYFGDGESGIKSIGGISGGTGGGSTGGGLTPEQIEILSFWKKDPDNPNTIFTEMNAYSKLELSAYGAGDGGGSGGSDYERLDTWADYDSSKAGWVLSAFLGNDLNTRVTNLENSGGSGSVTSVGISVPTGLSVSNSPITSSGVIAIGLQTGYSIPTTEKQGQWDTAYSNTHTHSNKTVLDGITSGLISNWNTAYGWGNHANKYSHIAHSGYSNSIRSADNRNVEDTPTSRNAGLYIDLKTSAAANLAGSLYVGVLTFRPYGANTDISGGGIMQIGSNNNSLYYRRFIDADTWGDWVSIWHSGDFTQAEVTNWREVRTWWQNVGQYLKRDATNQALYTDENFYSTKEVSAYGIGSGGGSGGGGIIETVYGYGNLGQSFNNATLTDTFNAYTINQINTRLVAVESGSALTVNTTGTGNAITSISKSGSVITAHKDLTFLETSIFNTHNTDNVRHITGAERTKWDGVVTDFNNLEIGGRNLILNTSSVLKEGVYSGISTPYLDGGYATVLDNGVYTVSIYVQGITGTGVGVRLRTYWYLNSHPNLGTLYSQYIYEDGVISFTTNNKPTDANRLYVALAFSSSVSDFPLSYAKLKVEKGTIPTDWTPAPEDQVSDWLTTDVNSFSFIKNKPTLLSQFTDNIGVATHIANTSNPHSVTKAQVGLGNVDNTPDSAKNVLSATKLQTPRTIWGQSFDGTGNITGALSGATTIAASISVTSPKVIFNAAGWSMEQVGSELQMKHNNVLKMRFTSTGSIVATEEITAFA